MAMVRRINEKSLGPSGELESKRKKVTRRVSFPLKRLAAFVAVFPTTTIFDPQRSHRSTTFNTILLYFATLLSNITDINCHAISLQSPVTRSVRPHYSSCTHIAIIKTIRARN